MRLFLIFLIFTGAILATNLPRHYTKTLDNGLQIVAIPMKNGTGVITTNIFYGVGSRDEIMGKSGIAHMLEHLNFKSTKNLKAGEFDTIVKGFGGVNNASTSFDYTHYYIKSSTKNMSRSLELFAELQANLTLNDDEFQKERDVVAQERLWRTDNSPMGLLYFKLFNNTFTYHPYHWTPIGFMNDIKNWHIDDIRQFHSKYYSPNNSIVVVSGDIEADVVFDEATNYFKNNKNISAKPKQTLHTVEPIQDGEKTIIIKKQTAVQMFAMAYHIPNFKHPDQVALSALSELLSSGKSSLLYKKLVDEKQMLSSVYAYNMELKDPGVFLFVGVCQGETKAVDAIKSIKKIIKDIQSKGVAKKELEKIIINTKSDFVFSLENSSEVASLYGHYLVRGDMAPLLNYEKNINNLKTKDIQDMATKYLRNFNLTTIILKNKE